jgi:translation initiation factor IF-1
MAKDEKLTVSGEITDILPNTMFKVKLLEENLNHEIIAYLGGKLRQHNIKIIQGDIVDVEMTPYDLSKGRIVYRNK